MKKGDKVRFTNKSLHAISPEFFPEPGTIGKIGYIHGNGSLRVQWPKGSTSLNDYWCVAARDVEIVE